MIDVRGIVLLVSIEFQAIILLPSNQNYGNQDG